MIHHPKHPGLLVQRLCLDPLDLTVTDAAKALKVARPTLSKLLHGHIGVSPEMAIRLSIVFSTSAKLWVDMQAGYDLWKAQQHASRLRLKPIIPRKKAA